MDCIFVIYHCRERGQLVVVGALVLAATIVAMALVLHAAVFTDPATIEGSPIEAWDATEFVDEAERGLGGVVRFVNSENRFPTYQTLNDSYVEGARNWTDQVQPHHAVAGRGVATSPNRTVNGTRIAQNESDQFLSPNGSVDWNVTGKVDRVRHFRLNVSNSSLQNDQGFADDAQSYRESDYFRVNITPDTATTKGVYLFQGSNGEVRLRVDRGGAEMSRPCEFGPADHGDVTIHLTKHLIEGELCHPLDSWYHQQEDFGIEFENGGNVRGGYELYVDRGLSEIDPVVQDYNNDGTASPFAERIIYAGRSTIEYVDQVARFAGTYELTPQDRRGLTVAQPTVGTTTFDSDVIWVNSTSGDIKNRSGVTIDPGPSGAEALGCCIANYDGDPADEVPFINGNEELLIADDTGDRTVLASNTDPERPRAMPIAVADIDGDPETEFVYINNGNKLYQVDTNGNSGSITNANGSDVLARGVADVADFDGDGTDDIVYVNDSTETLSYLDGGVGGANVDVGVTIDNPLTVSEMADVDGDSDVDVPFIDNNKDLAWADATGTVGTYTPTVEPRNAHLSVVPDEIGGPAPDVAYIDNGQDKIRVASPESSTDGSLINEVVRSDPGLG